MQITARDAIFLTFLFFALLKRTKLLLDRCERCWLEELVVLD